MLFRSIVLLRTTVFALVLGATYFYGGGQSTAQANLNLIKTDAPDQFMNSVLTDIKADGMSSIRTLFQEMGLLNPQTESMIGLFEGMEGESDARWMKNMGHTQNQGVLQQHYAYAYLGNNAFLFIRVDFFRTSDSEWALVNFTFNSDYRQLITADFGFLD